MISAQALIQLKAFARQDGFILSMVWLAGMWLTFRCPESSWGGIVTLSTPFFVVWRVQSFRNDALDGYISFRRALAFSCYIFFYASLVFALGQFVYFKFLDDGAFMQLLSNNVETLKVVYESQGVTAADLDLALETLRLMSPADLAFLFMMCNLMTGAFLCPIISLFCKKRKRKTQETETE